MLPMSVVTSNVEFIHNSVGNNAYADCGFNNPVFIFYNIENVFLL